MSDPRSGGDAGTCPNCGAERLGPYCHDCGQRRIIPEERSLRHFMGQFVNALSFLDGGFPRTLGLLAVRPVRLAAR